MLLRWFEHTQVYHPDRVMEGEAADLGRPAEDVTFRTPDGTKLNGWYFPAAPDSPRRQMALLFCHGNAGNISHRLGTCGALLSTGINVFVFDYRGFGRSEGVPSEAGTYQDTHTAYHWLEAKGFAGSNMVAFGESLGGGIASELALHKPLAGLVLQSTFTSIPDIGAELFPWLPVRWFGTIKYDTRARLPSLRLPVLVMHSRGDELAAFHHAERNFAAANEPKLFWEFQGGHNDTLEDRDHFIAGIEKFLSMIEARPGKKNEQ